MTWVAEGVRTSWLFTREDKSVRLEVHRTSHGLRLIVEGPGTARASHDFPDLAALLAHQRVHQQQLADEGFTLQEFHTERRRWPR